MFNKSLGYLAGKQHIVYVGESVFQGAGMSDKTTVKLGLMPPLTGLVGIYGSEIVHAAQVACQEINEEGGVLGMPLELVIEDDGSLPESAVVAAGKLVHEHKCTAIIGNLLSNSRIAVAYRVAEPNKVPYLNFSFYEGSILSRYFFHFAALPNQQIHKMIPYMSDRFGKRMFFAGNNYEWPRGSIDAAKIALQTVNGNIVGEEYLPIGVDENVIDGLLDRVEQASPDVFVPYFAGSDQVTLLTRFTARGLKRRMAVVMGHYDEMMASQLPADVREGFYSSNTYFMTVASDKNREFLERLEKIPDVDGIWPEGNGILTNFGEGTYACVKAFARAANSAKSLDAEQLIETLKNISVDSPQGTLTMNPVHHHAKVNTYLSRCDARGVFNIVEKFGAIEPSLPERYNHQRISHQATLEDDIRLQARMLEQMSDGVLLVSTTDEKIIYANAGAEKMLGFQDKELCHLSFSEIYSGNVNQRISAVDYEELISILNNKGEWKGISDTLKKDGELIWCDTSISTFTHPIYGEVWLATFRDISERISAESALRHSENRYRRIERATNDGLWEWNVQTGYDYFSPRWLEMLGYSENELPYKVETFVSLVHPDDSEPVKNAIEIHFTQGVNFDMEMRLKHKQGHYIWVRSRGQVEKDQAGEPVLMAGTIIDITESKKAEVELNKYRWHLEELVEERTRELTRARDEAQRASQAKSTFLSRMSHELRTPMNAILGFTQVLEIGNPTGEQSEYIREILTAGNHLLGLIEELLDLSRIESGKLLVNIGEINLSYLLKNVLQITRPLAINSKISISNNCPDGYFVQADETRLSQIFINLITNATKYNNAGGIILLSCEMKSANILTVSVSDTGEGINEEDIPKLFRPFERLGAEKSGIDGTGIGLALSQKLAELMGARIYVVSKKGVGSTFSIDLPLAIEKTAPLNSDVAVRVLSDECRNILYIEDNAANMRVVEAMLKSRKSINFIPATNGEYGLEMAQLCAPDVILLDIQLPGMDGYQILEKLQENPNTKNIPVIAVSADAMPIDIEEGLKSGFKHYITKPIEIEMLINAINDVLPAKSGAYIAI